MERVNREIKHRTRAIGAFPDGQSALMLVCARLRSFEASDWESKRYLNMVTYWKWAYKNRQTTKMLTTDRHQMVKLIYERILTLSIKGCS